MKKVRILSLALALLMLVGLASIFTGCKKTDGIVTLKGGEKKVDITGYTLVYGNPIETSEFSATYNNKINAFADRISAYTGEKYPAFAVTRTRSTAADPEILIGLTPRTESQEALASISGEGFVITLTENKIVIAGTTNLLTLMALEYFTENYLALPDAPTTELSVPKSAKANNVEQLTIASSARGEEGNLDEAVENDYVYIHSDDLGKLAPAYAGTSSGNANGTYKEYEQNATEELSAMMQQITGVAAKYFKVKSDTGASAKEIQVGRVDREENRALLAEVDANEYVVSFEGDKIMVTGWSLACTKAAVQAFKDLVADGTVKDTTGSVTVTVPKGLRITGIVNENWVLDFPKPEGEGIKLHNTMDANHNAYQFLYLGEGVNDTAYKNYIQQLKAAGYEDYMPENQIEGSYFSTLVNEEEKKMLYVAYNAYTHMDDFSDFDWVLSKKKTGDKGVYDYDPALRIISAPLDSANLPDEKILSPNKSYKKVTDSMVSTMPLGSGAVGLSYVVTLEDGSFIVFDGGNVSTSGAEYDRLWKVLNKLNEDITGKVTSSSNPVHIAAWVLTHGHGDHFRVFNQFLKKYGPDGRLVMDYMIANIVGVDSVSTFTSIANEYPTSLIAEMQKVVKGGFKYLKVHTGQRLYLANCEIEVLMTWEDHNPLAPNNTNETNTVLRFALSNKDAPTAPEYVQIWTGDANRWQSRYMCAMYGEYLKADMVSIAHHGNNGCEIDFYEMVDPTVVWWPHNLGSVKSYLNETHKNSDFRHQVDQYVCRELESVKYVYTSGASNSSTAEEYYTTVKITASGADCEGVFDLMTGEKLGTLYTSVNTPSALMKK